MWCGTRWKETTHVVSFTEFCGAPGRSMAAHGHDGGGMGGGMNDVSVSLSASRRQPHQCDLRGFTHGRREVSGGWSLSFWCWWGVGCIG